jgi:hypothetical protein
MYRRLISLAEYETLCAQTDVSPNYHPRFADYYFARLGMRPKLVGVYGKEGLVAAFPSLYGQVFPTPVHKRVLGERFSKIGEMGQPESLFPVLPGSRNISLNRFSPTTSSLLRENVRGLRDRQLKSMAIAIDRRHKKLTIRQRQFFDTGGKAHFTDQLDAKTFAEIYLELHSQRWGYDRSGLSGVREQILALYDHVFGVVLEVAGEPVAAQLCYKALGATVLCVDFINSGVKLQNDNKVSHGSIMMLTCLRRAEEDAKALGRRLRFSFGYYYGDQTYKAVWTQPEPTFIGY